ncbi:trans-aconitate 2-methyltransferase [soil metagenome]
MQPNIQPDARSDAWNPAQYDRFRDQRAQPFFDLLALVRPQPDMNVVDLGCGTGELTRQMHETLRAKQTLGIDHSDNMLSRAAAINVSGLRFQKGDLAAFDSPGAFDLVFSNAAIQWAPDHANLLARLARCLRDGGQLAIQVPANDDHITHEAARAVARQSPFRETLRGWTRDRAVLNVEIYAQILYDLGFREQNARLVVYPHLLDDRNAVVEWVKGTMLTDYQKRLPGEIWMSFLDAYRDELFKFIPDIKPFFYPFKRILFWAQK